MLVSEVMNREVYSINNNDSVSKALSLMEKEHVKELPVISGSKVKGLITFHSIITNTNYSPSTKVARFSFKPPLVSENTDLLEVINLMAKSGVEGLPVVDNHKLVGFISDYDIINALKDSFTNLTVNDLMNDLPPTLKLNDEVATARRLFYYSKVNSLPVVNNDKFIGSLTEDSLLLFFKPHESMGFSMSEGNSLRQLKAKIKDLELINNGVLAGSKLIKAINYMLKNHFKSLIIINNNENPIGYLSRFNLINYLYKKNKPLGVNLNISGYETDYLTNSLLTSITIDFIKKLSYIKLSSVNIHIKPIHASEGKKFELSVKVVARKTYRSISNGYSLPELLRKALNDIEKVIKKEYKKD